MGHSETRVSSISILVFLGLVVMLNMTASSSKAAVDKIDCSRSRLVVSDFSGLTCEVIENDSGDDYMGQFDYYGVMGEQGYVFRNIELAIAGLRSFIDPDLQLALRPHFENRFFWIAEAKNWSEEKKAGNLSYITFEIPFGKCIGFFRYEKPQKGGYKYALNGVYCHKGDRAITVTDLKEYLRDVSYN